MESSSQIKPLGPEVAGVWRGFEGEGDKGEEREGVMMKCGDDISIMRETFACSGLLV